MTGNEMAREVGGVAMQALITRLTAINVGRTTVVLRQIVTRLAADEYQVGTVYTTLEGAAQLLIEIDAATPTA